MLFLPDPAGPSSEDINGDAPTLQACRKWLAEEQTGHDSSEERLDRDSCYPGQNSTGNTTPNLHYVDWEKKEGVRIVRLN